MWYCRSGGTSSRRPSSEMTPAGGQEENRREVRGGGGLAAEAPATRIQRGTVGGNRWKGVGLSPPCAHSPVHAPQTPLTCGHPKPFTQELGRLWGPGSPSLRSATMTTPTAGSPSAHVPPYSLLPVRPLVGDTGLAPWTASILCTACGHQYPRRGPQPLASFLG